MGDKTAMRHSLEARVPFLDLDYLRTVEAVHGTQRVARVGRRKALQHDVAVRLLPPAPVRSLAASPSLSLACEKHDPTAGTDPNSISVGDLRPGAAGRGVLG